MKRIIALFSLLFSTIVVANPVAVYSPHGPITTAPYVVTVMNVGDAPMTFTSITVIGFQRNAFVLVNDVDACSVSTPLAPGATCTITALPGSAVGRKVMAISFRSDGGNGQIMLYAL